MNRKDCIAVFILLAGAALLTLPFLAGPFALFPFHSHSQSPWSADKSAEFVGESENQNVGDKHLIIFPDLVHTSQQLKQGRIPLWNPHNFAGLPHQAVPLTATLYPFTAIASLMNPVDAIALNMIIHLFLAALFCYIFLRGIRVSPKSALLGAVCWAFSGWMMVHVHHSYFVQTMVWLPLSLFAVDRILQARPRWALMLLAMSVGLMLMAGFPQTAIVNLYFIAAYALVGLVRVGRQEGAEVAIRRGRFLLFFAILGLLLASIQLLPTIDFKRSVGHQDRSYQNLKADSLRTSTLVHLLAPDFFGNPTEQSRPQENFFTLWLLSSGRPTGHVANNYSERSFYVGILALILAVLTPFFRRDRPAMTLYFGALVSILLALGTPLLWVAMKLPAMDFGSPMRITQIAGFALPCLFAMTLDRMLALGRDRLHKFWKSLTVSMAIFLALVAGILVALWFAEDWSCNIFVALLRTLGADHVLGTASLSLPRQTELALEPMHALRSTLGIVLGFAFAAWLVLVGIIHSKKSVRVLYGAAFIVVALELGYYGYRFNRPVPSARLYEPTPGIDFLSKHLDGARFIRFGKDATSSFFVPNTGLIYGLNDAQGYRAMTPQSYLNFMRTLEPNPHDVGLFNLDDRASLLSPQLDLLRTKYVCSPTAIENSPLDQVYPPANSSGEIDMFIYENKDILPRAFMVHHVKVMPNSDAQAAFATLKSESETENPFGKTVWLEEMRLGMRSQYPEPKGVEAAIVAEDRPGKLAFDLKVEADGILVVTEQFSPGWHAKITSKDGKTRNEKLILRADMTFMAVPVAADDTHIEFAFRPESFKWGGLLSGLALIFLLLVPLIGPLSTPVVRITRIEEDGTESRTGIEKEEP